VVCVVRVRVWAEGIWAVTSPVVVWCTVSSVRYCGNGARGLDVPLTYYRVRTLEDLITLLLSPPQTPTLSQNPQAENPTRYRAGDYWPSMAAVPLLLRAARRWDLASPLGSVTPAFLHPPSPCFYSYSVLVISCLFGNPVDWSWFLTRREMCTSG